HVRLLHPLRRRPMNRPVIRLLELALTAIGIAVAATAYAADISGTVPATGLVITNNSRLVGDVDCTSVTDGVACITFGAPNITLKLNGFTMTGRADEVCTGPNGFNGTGGFVPGEAGISTGGYSNVSIVGPGVIRFFRENGITTFVNLNTMSTNVVIK